MNDATALCPECEGLIGADEWFCPHCLSYRGSPCPECGLPAGLGEGLCPAGHLVPTPGPVLEKRRQAREQAESRRLPHSRSVPPVPVPPGPRHPTRPAVADPLEFVGQPSRVLLRALGPPDDRRRGLTLEALEGAFGPRPSCLPQRARFDEWVYHNVDGEEWVFWLVKGTALTHPPTRGDSYAVEFTAYPSGAVF